MKKLLLSVFFAASVFMSLFMLNTTAGAYIHYESVDDYDDCVIYYDADFENCTAAVTGFCPYNGKVIIPEKVKAYNENKYTTLTVTKIRKSDSSEYFDYIYIPESVTEIDKYAVGYVWNYIYDENDYYDDEEYDFYDEDYILYNSTANDSNYEYSKIEGFTVGCIKNSYAETYALENGFNISYITDISELTISLSGTSFTYNFDAIEPAVKVKNGGKTLKEGTDYTLEYYNNYSVGTATVTVNCTGNYKGTRTLSYKINAIDVSKLSFSEVEDHEFTGNAYEPYVYVTYGNRYLYEGDDYSVTYKNNKKPGTASVILKFKGIYKGTKTIKFKIYIPEITDITAETNSNCVELSWKCDSWYVNYYYVYRYNAKKKKYVKLGTADYGFYRDAKLKSDTVYKYKIIPVVKNEKKETKGTAAFCEFRTRMVSPETEITLLKNSVKIKYTKVKGAEGYIIYRRRWDNFTEEQEIKTIKGSKASSYTDKTINPNGTYQYTVAAYKTVNGKKITGDTSPEAYTSNPDAILRGAKLKPMQSFTVYNTQGETTTSYTYNLSDNDIKIVKKFAEDHFKKGMTDAEKLQYTLNWINSEVLYARGENWNKISGKTWVDAIYTYKLGQCAQYNGAMAAMLVYMGYDASIIKGFRGSGTQHFWCEVKIQGRTYVMETGNYSSSGAWSYFLQPYSHTQGYVKNKKPATDPSLGPDVKSLKLSKETYVYDGKAKKPSVKAVNTEGKTLKQGTDYTVVYSKGRKNFGNYTVTVTFKGKYAGKETLEFSIVPKAPVVKLKAGKKKITASWNKIDKATSYKVEISYDKNFYWEDTDYIYTDKTKVTFKNLDKKQKYYVRVKAIAEDDYYTSYYSLWSDVKSTKTK